MYIIDNIKIMVARFRAVAGSYSHNVIINSKNSRNAYDIKHFTYSQRIQCIQRSYSAEHFSQHKISSILSDFIHKFLYTQIHKIRLN